MSSSIPSHTINLSQRWTQHLRDHANITLSTPSPAANFDQHRAWRLRYDRSTKALEKAPQPPTTQGLNVSQLKDLNCQNDKDISMENSEIKPQPRHHVVGKGKTSSLRARDLQSPSRRPKAKSKNFLREDLQSHQTTNSISPPSGSQTLNPFSASILGSKSFGCKDQFKALDIILQPETHPISQEELVAEFKGIYAGLVMVEAKCIEVDNKQQHFARDAAAFQSFSSINHEEWQALISLHRTLLHEHHDFFLASQHPSASPALRKLASKYAMPARMWRHGIHSFLELLRHRLPASLDHMLAFIYLAYSMMALLYETVPTFETTWIECLGDLGRYRMAIEDDDIRDREAWIGVARHWYSKASDKSPVTGRLYHHLAILARRNALQQLFYYTKSLYVMSPLASVRKSILTLFKPMLDPVVDPPVSLPSNSCKANLCFELSIFQKCMRISPVLEALPCHLRSLLNRFSEYSLLLTIMGILTFVRPVVALNTPDAKETNFHSSSIIKIIEDVNIILRTFGIPSVDELCLATFTLLTTTILFRIATHSRSPNNWFGWAALFSSLILLLVSPRINGFQLLVLWVESVFLVFLYHEEDAKEFGTNRYYATFQIIMTILFNIFIMLLFGPVDSTDRIQLFLVSLLPSAIVTIFGARTLAKWLEPAGSQELVIQDGATQKLSFLHAMGDVPVRNRISRSQNGRDELSRIERGENH